MSNNTQAERITALEVQVGDCRSEIRELGNKIDELLALKNKGMGAFWLASIIIGGVFTGLVTLVSDWIK